MFILLVALLQVSRVSNDGSKLVQVLILNYVLLRLGLHYLSSLIRLVVVRLDLSLFRLGVYPLNYVLSRLGLHYLSSLIRLVVVKLGLSLF